MNIRRMAFKNLDPRELPNYSPAEAARYLRMPLSTLRTWFFGYGSMPPVIQPADSRKRLLSFLDLVEAHVLLSIRKVHHIPLPAVRKALQYIRTTISSEHPLAVHEFETSGRELFVKYLGGLIGVTQEGQTAMSEVLKIYLHRIERDEKGLARQFFPYVLSGVEESIQPRLILIDPTISAGRPVLAGTGIPTRVVAERHFAGESIDDLAKDYGRERLEIEEILRCESRLAA